MNRGKTFQKARQEFQDRSKSLSDDEIAQIAFVDAPDPVAKLKRIEANEQVPTREEVRRLLRIYKPETRTISDHLLAPYSISEELAALVEPSGRSRRAIADEAGVSYHHLIRILNGKRLVKSDEQLVTLAKALRAPAETIAALLEKANTHGTDPVWSNILATRDLEDLERDLHLVNAFCGDLARFVGQDRWKGLSSSLSTGDYKRAARGPHAICALATNVVRHQKPSRTESKPKESAVKISLGERFVGDELLLDGFFASVADVLTEGGDVRVLLPQPDDTTRLFRAIRTGLSFLGRRGHFDLRYVEQQGRISSPLRLIISRAGRVLHLFPREPRHADDSAAIVPDPDQVYRRHFDTRYERGEPLLRLFQSENQTAASLQRALSQAEITLGKRLVLRRRFPRTMIPVAYWQWERDQMLRSRPQSGRSSDPWRFERLAFESSASGSEREARIEELLARKIERYQRHVENLFHHPTREILSKRSLTRFLDSLVDMPDLRVAIIDQYLEWLENAEKFSLALVEDHDIFQGSLFGVHGQSVFLSIPRENARADYLSVTHRFACEAFEAKFAHLWKSLPAHNTDKQAVIEQLRALLPSRTGMQPIHTVAASH